MDLDFVTLLHWTTRAIEVFGILAIVVGIVGATIRYLREWLSSAPGEDTYRTYRSSVGRSILLGLELLVAADIINTVAIEPSLQSLAVLAGIVAIRTFLSVSLEVEIDGRWPWRKEAAGRGERSRATLGDAVPLSSTRTPSQT
ncbi:DUF1622 domain-containing protein [Aureimonas sp. ME7]|uniref:DUF1622 domain-containing protein n=1 Tax=Aureimonas sp. ME7 TaxID=2744252 RepID=UPI0015F5786F|nr:DUF1622 domain-containing protein [Aureimonas sp. ME7]